MRFNGNKSNMFSGGGSREPQRRTYDDKMDEYLDSEIYKTHDIKTKIDKFLKEYGYNSKVRAAYQEKYLGHLKKIVNDEISRENITSQELLDNLFYVQVYLRQLNKEIVTYFENILEYVFKYLVEDTNSKTRNVVILSKKFVTSEKYRVYALDLESGQVIIISDNMNEENIKYGYTSNRKLLKYNVEEVIKIKLKKYKNESVPNVYMYDESDIKSLGITNMNKLMSKSCDYRIIDKKNPHYYYGSKCCKNFQDLLNERDGFVERGKEYYLVNFSKTQLRWDNQKKKIQVRMLTEFIDVAVKGIEEYEGHYMSGVVLLKEFRNKDRVYYKIIKIYDKNIPLDEKKYKKKNHKKTHNDSKMSNNGEKVGLEEIFNFDELDEFETGYDSLYDEDIEIKTEEGDSSYFDDNEDDLEDFTDNYYRDGGSFEQEEEEEYWRYFADYDEKFNKKCQNISEYINDEYTRAGLNYIKLRFNNNVYTVTDETDDRFATDFSKVDLEHKEDGIVTFYNKYKAHSINKSEFIKINLEGIEYIKQQLDIDESRVNLVKEDDELNAEYSSIIY